MIARMEDRMVWAGWEYLTTNELHMIESKRHLFRREDARSNRPVASCGAVAARGVSSGVGRDTCKKCERIADKLAEV
jgi:hypothetical protein